MTENEVKKKLSDLQANDTFSGINDLYIYNCDPGKLVIAGSFDFSYYHNIEIKFTDVSFISCPGGGFHADVIRLANETEKAEIRKYSYGHCDGHIFCFEEKEPPAKFYVVADDIDFQVKTVYYYKRENLKENETIADWVKQ